MSLNLIEKPLVDAQLIQQFDVYFLIRINIFHYLKLEVALAIPALN